MNWKRVLLSGFVAGVVMNFVDFLVNGPWLGAQWQAAASALGRQGDGGMVGWIVTDFLMGFTVAWIYAGIRPRFGAGPRTALIAGVMKSLMCVPVFWSYVFMNLFPANLVAMSCFGGLIGTFAAVMAAGALYKEEGGMSPAQAGGGRSSRSAMG